MNKRQVPNKKMKNITFSDLTKILATINIDPTIADGTIKLYDESTSGNYWRIFGDEGAQLKYYDDNVSHIDCTRTGDACYRC